MFNLLLSDYPIVVIFIAGMIGAIVSDIIKDNCLELPKKIGGKFFLGWIGCAFIGGFAGIFIDGSFITAFMAGYLGKDIITNLARGREFQLTEQK